MAGVPIKFRCYRCNQLLGVAPSKVGSVVACPKCSADLVVPDPIETDNHPDTDSPEIPNEHSTGSTTPTLLIPAFNPTGALDTGVPLGYLDIRPEDIRVEPGVHRRSPTIPMTTLGTATDVPEIDRAGSTDPELTMATTLPQYLEPAPQPPPTTASAPVVVATTIRPVTDPIVASIKLDAPIAAPTRISPSTVRSRDLVLPRSIVASWSLFVLLALVCAFFAGLFAGHYVWRVH